MRTGDCVSLALYDWATDITALDFYNVAVSFFSAAGAVPDSGTLHLGTSRASRTLKHSTIAGRITQQEYEHATSLELYRTFPNYAQLVFGWDVTAGYHTGRHREMYFCCGATVAQLGMDYMADLIEKVSHLTELTYGIGYSRAFEKGPDLYALGMCTRPDYSDEGIREDDRVSAWFRERIGENRHLQGYLRDVYPLNVISQPHLDMPVDGVQLHDWIGAAPERGALRPLARDAWLWRIDENHVAKVQTDLEAAGLLIAELGSTRRNRSSK